MSTTESGYEDGDVNLVDGGDVDEDLEYEDGDVNTIGTAAPLGEPAEVLGPESTAVRVLTYLAKSLADEPEAVAIDPVERRGTHVLKLRVAPPDMGRVIGRRGRTAQAIRTLVAVAGAREGVSATVDIVDD